MRPQRVAWQRDLKVRTKMNVKARSTVKARKTKRVACISTAAIHGTRHAVALGWF
jgi:hypothetical protein